MFRRSWSKIEKCWNPSRWANIISFKESPVVPRLEPCCFMRSNNYLTLGMKSLRHRVEQAILKNSIILLNKKFRDVRLYMRHSYNWKEKGVSFIKISNITYTANIINNVLLPRFYQKKLVMTCTLPHVKIKKDGTGSIPIGMSMDCFIVIFPALK